MGLNHPISKGVSTAIPVHHKTHFWSIPDIGFTTLRSIIVIYEPLLPMYTKSTLARILHYKPTIYISLVPFTLNGWYKP
jgi:hypothetical protein